MRRFVFLLLMGMLLAMPTATAASDCEDAPIVKIPLVIDATNVHVCLHHADTYGEIGDQITGVLRVSVPSATTTSITITAGTPIGCTAGTPTTRSWSTAAGSGASHFNLFTTTDTTCAVSLRVLVTASTTTIYDSEYAWTASCDCVHKPMDGDGAGRTSYEQNGWRVYGPPEIIEVPYSANAVAIPLYFDAYGPITSLSSINDGHGTTAMDGTCTASSLSSAGVTGTAAAGNGWLSYFLMQGTVTFDAEACWVRYTVNGFVGVGVTAPFIHTFTTLIKRVEHPNVESWPGLDVLDDTTSDGALTVAGDLGIVVNVTVDSLNSTVNESNTTEIELGSFLFLALVFAVLVIWAEMRKEPMLYVIAILVGALMITGGWDEITGTMRSALVVVLLYLGLRLFITREEAKDV